MLKTNLQNILFCVQREEETHTVLEQLEDEKMMTEFSLLGEISLRLEYITQLLKSEYILKHWALYTY